jgi:hypothetical protein
MTALTGCADTGASGSDAGERVSTRITSYRVVEPSQVQLSVESCNAAPAVAEVRESEQEVVVRVVADAPDPEGQDLCGDGVNLDLRAALGDRQMVDATTGEPVRRE